MICLGMKNFNPMVTELFIISEVENKTLLLFLSHSHSTHYFIMKIPNKQEQTAFNHSSDIDFQDFMNLYKHVLQNHFIF